MSLNSDAFWKNLLEKVSIADRLKNCENQKVAILDLEKLLKMEIPNSTIRIYPFGSLIMGIGQKDSDLDIFVEFDDSFNDYSDFITCVVLEREKLIASAIKSHCNWVYEVSYLGKCPIVKALYQPSRLQCDISFTNGLTVSQNKLVVYIFELQPIARYMVLYLRGFVEKHNLQDGFRCHILTLMVIYFLQSNDYLPGINKLQEYGFPSNGPWITAFKKFELSKFMMVKIDLNEIQTRKMLKRFFEFYSKFQFEKYAICPYLGTKLINRNSLLTLMPNRYKTNRHYWRDSILIIDMIYFNQNKGMLIRDAELVKFKNMCFNEAAQ